MQVIEAVGATTTLLIERLLAHRLRLTPFEATVLALGLYEETGSLSFPSTTVRDVEAAAQVLRAGADLRMVAETLQRRIVPEQIALLDDLVQGGETLYVEGHKLLLASSTNDQYRGDLAEVVQQLAELQGYEAVLAAITLGQKGDKVQVIGRSRTPTLDVGQVAKAFGGGGHPQAAAATVHGQTPLEVRARLRALLTGSPREAGAPASVMAGDVMTVPVKAVHRRASVLDT
jgi:tRNA nucleotidyltransferase (CCA-adding enzyme)